MARALGLGPRGREFESRIPEVKKLISYKIKRFSGYIALLDLVKYLEGGFEIGLVACYLLSGVCQMIKINFFFEELLAIIKEIVI